MARSKRNQNIAILSTHAKVRMRERTNIQRKHYDREATQALRVGLSHSQVTGSLRRFLDKTYLKFGTASNLRVHRGYVWIFKGNILVTIYNILENKENTHETGATQEPFCSQVG